GYDKIYNLFLPRGQDTCFDSRNCYSPDVWASFTFCAYHSSMNVPDAVGNIIHVLYTVIPYQNVVGCQRFGPNGPLIGSTNSTLSHETFETITDPDALTAWYRDFDNKEIGDICSEILANPINLNGSDYAIQQEYSNMAQTCVASMPRVDTFSVSPSSI